jgi:hypothetical protein
MYAIERYVADKNNWNSLFGKNKLSLLAKADRQRIADMLDADLSPENLTCDGELPRAEVQKRYNFLTKAAKELKSIDPAVEMYGF